MKIISLNTWGGRAGEENLLKFIEHHHDADVFCLQEMWSAPYEHHEGYMAGGVPIEHSNIMTEGVQRISSLLSETHVSYFHPQYLDNYGLQLLVRKELEVQRVGDIFVYKHGQYVPEGDIGGHARNIQFVTVDTSKGLRTIINFHGLWNGGGKADSEERLEQSDRIIEFLKTLDHPFVLCGDFNLLPDTESLQKFEQFGLRNLIKENGITNTRSSHYEKPMRFADYTFVSEGIGVKRFEVLPDEVSDHLPMLLEFE